MTWAFMARVNGMGVHVRVHDMGVPDVDVHGIGVFSAGFPTMGVHNMDVQCMAVHSMAVPGMGWTRHYISFAVKNQSLKTIEVQTPISSYFYVAGSFHAESSWHRMKYPKTTQHILKGITIDWPLKRLGEYPY
jgi:hypothetical protein